MFCDLKYLKELYLNKYQLKNLDANLFAGLENLKELDLSYNDLSHFDVTILSRIEFYQETKIWMKLLFDFKYIFINWWFALLF